MEEPAGPVLPSTIGFSTRAAIRVLEARGVAVAPLLQRAGLSAVDRKIEPHHIPAAAQSRLLEYAAEALEDNAFGLHLAQRENPRRAGLLFYVASAAATLDGALALLARYFRIVNEAVRMQLVRTAKGVVAEFRFVGVSRHLARQNIEFGLAVILKALREVVDRRLLPMRVTFVHARNSDLKEFERFFGCPVEFGASTDQLAFSSDTIALPLLTEDPHLLETLQPICDEAAKERGVAIHSLRANVENEVQKLLPHGKAQRQNIAKALAMSARTLSRRLADEGTTFEKVLDELRRSLALRYVKQPDMSLSQIAWLLGYEGSTSFNHAFLRWAGRSPSAARKEKALPSLSQIRLS